MTSKRTSNQSRNSSWTQPQFTGYKPDRSAAPPQTFELRHRSGVMLSSWTTPDSSLGPGTLQTGYGPLTQSDPFLLRHSCKNSHHSFPEHSGAVQILLGIGTVSNAI
jgi:hypothetical protein